MILAGQDGTPYGIICGRSILISFKFMLFPYSPRMTLDEERFLASYVCEDSYFTNVQVFSRLGGLFARLFIALPITPNQITWLWGGLMIVSALLYSTGDYCYSIIGGLAWVIAYSMDYSDGTVARYKGLKSPRGGFLDKVIHHTTYPLLMFCIGYGAYKNGGGSVMEFFTWFQDIWFIFLGVLAGISIVVFLASTQFYEEFKPETEFDGDRGSLQVEGKLVKNKRLFKKLMNINPLVFTNMMLMLPVFAILGQMGLFIVFYGIGYAAVAIVRVLIYYRDLDPPRQYS